MKESDREYTMNDPTTVLVKSHYAMLSGFVPVDLPYALQRLFYYISFFLYFRVPKK